MTDSTAKPKPSKSKYVPLHALTFACMECGKKFKTAKAAERASYNGCPKCGGCDIDIDTGS